MDGLIRGRLPEWVWDTWNGCSSSGYGDVDSGDGSGYGYGNGYGQGNGFGAGDGYCYGFGYGNSCGHGEEMTQREGGR